jgi:hypothetical protein
VITGWQVFLTNTSALRAGFRSEDERRVPAPGRRAAGPGGDPDRRPEITGQGLLALAACPSLKKITLGRMKQVEADDIEALRRQRPDLELITR